MGLKQKLEQAAIDLREAKYHLAQCQKRFDELFRVATGGKAAKKSKAVGETEASVPIAETTPAIGRLIDRLEGVLLRAPSKTLHFEKIAQAVGTTPDSARAMLNKLQKLGRVTRIGRGTWRASTPTVLPDGKSEETQSK